MGLLIKIYTVYYIINITSNKKLFSIQVIITNSRYIYSKQYLHIPLKHDAFNILALNVTAHSFPNL